MTTVVVTIANQKGGVGKTTTAITLAHGLALKGRDTLLIDVDPQGQAATALGIAAEPGVYNWIAENRPIREVTRQAREHLFIIPGNKQTDIVQQLFQLLKRPADYLKTLLKPVLKSGPKYIIFDTSPSVGGLQERAIFAADLVIVPTATDYLSADAVAQTYATMQENIQYGWKGGAWVLPTFFDETTRESRQTLADLHGIYGGQVLESIHRATILRECAAEGRTIWEKDNHCRAAKEYAKLVYRVLTR